jgi:transcriptional regulator with XRE-family HTH domain
MIEDDKHKYGPIVDLVENDRQFANETAAFDLVQMVVAGLKRMRMRAGLTQAQLAERLGITQGRVSQMESGVLDHAPNFETVAKYARACGEEVGIAFSGERGQASLLAEISYRTEHNSGSNAGKELVKEDACVLDALKGLEQGNPVIWDVGEGNECVGSVGWYASKPGSIWEDIPLPHSAESSVAACEYATVIKAGDHLFFRGDVVQKVVPRLADDLAPPRKFRGL